MVTLHPRSCLRLTTQLPILKKEKFDWPRSSFQDKLLGMGYFYANKALIPVHCSLEKDTSNLLSPVYFYFLISLLFSPKSMLLLFQRRYLDSLQLEGNTRSDLIQGQPTEPVSSLGLHTGRCVGDRLLQESGQLGKTATLEFPVQHAGSCITKDALFSQSTLLFISLGGDPKSVNFLDFLSLASFSEPPRRECFTRRKQLWNKVDLVSAKTRWRLNKAALFPRSQAKNAPS